MRKTLSPLSLIALSFVLISCGPSSSSSTPSSEPSSDSSSVSSSSSISYLSPSSESSESVSSSEEVSSASSSSESISPKDSSSEGISSSSSKVSSSDEESSEASSSVSSDSSSAHIAKDTTITIYATNDIHGQVYPENPYSSNGRMGVATMMTYLKEAKDEDPHALLLDQGDTWQGSIYSNFNHGALITDIMNYVQYDARTVGNHDFDWGLTPLLENKLRSYEGYSVPVLAGNVYGYDFDSHIEDDRQMEEIGVKSVVKELDTGCRVGVVGVIGSNQITSISTIYAKDVCFKNHIEMAKEEAARLREEEECDVMILSIHAGQADVLGAGLNEYFDVALCGHTHRRETSKDGGMPVVQFGSYTQAIGKVELSFSASTKRVTSTKVTTLSSSTIYNEVDDVDPTIQKLIDDYGKDCDDIANGVVAYSVDGYFDKGKTLPNLMCEAIYDQALREGFDVDFAYCNEARHYIGNDYGTTKLYFADLFEAFPFDNEVFIITVTASEVRSEILGYNSIYHDPDKPISIDEGKTYTIASIDFLAFHTNSRREFDFFPSMANYAIENIQKLSYNYREILARYLIGNGYAEEGAKSLKASDYSSTLPQFDQGRYY